MVIIIISVLGDCKASSSFLFAIDSDEIFIPLDSKNFKM